MLKKELFIDEQEATMPKEEYTKDMIMHYELEQCSIPPRTAEHMRQAVTFKNECNCVQRRFYRSLQDAKVHRLMRCLSRNIKVETMKYKKVSENKYRRCMGVLTEALLIVPILVAFLILGAIL